MFNFNPLNGLLDTTIYPAEPASEDAARQQFMDLFNQVKNFMNSMENTASLSSSGWFKDNKTGLILQWGVNGFPKDNYGAVINYAIEFPAGCIGTWIVMTGSDTIYPVDTMYSVQLWNKAQFKTFYNKPRSEYQSFYWFAIGW